MFFVILLIDGDVVSGFGLPSLNEFFYELKMAFILWVEKFQKIILQFSGRVDAQYVSEVVEKRKG